MVTAKNPPCFWSHDFMLSMSSRYCIAQSSCIRQVESRSWVKGGHLTDLKNMADYQNVENILHANILFSALKRLTVLRKQLPYQITKYMEQVKR